MLPEGIWRGVVGPQVDGCNAVQPLQRQVLPQVGLPRIGVTGCWRMVGCRSIRWISPALPARANKWPKTQYRPRLGWPPTMATSGLDTKGLSARIAVAMLPMSGLLSKVEQIL